MAAGLGIIEVARRIGLQSHRELVEVFGDLMIVVEAVDEVGLPVSVEIDEPGKLVAAEHEQLAAAELHPERLEKAARDAPPRQRRGGRVHHAIDAPDIAVPHRDNAALPSGVKSKPPGRSQLCQGLSSGRGNSSARNAPPVSPGTEVVVTV